MERTTSHDAPASHAKKLCVVMGPLSDRATAIEMHAVANKLTNEQHCDYVGHWLQYPSIAERQRHAEPESAKLSYFRPELERYHGRSTPVLIGVKNDIPDMFPDFLTPDPDESLLLFFLRVIGEEPAPFHLAIAQNVHGVPAMLAITRNPGMVAKIREMFREIIGVGPICESNARATVNFLSDQMSDHGCLPIAYAGDRWEPVIDLLQLRGIDESANVVIDATQHHRVWVFAHGVTLEMLRNKIGGTIQDMGPGYPAGSSYLELGSHDEARRVTDLLHTADHVRRTQ